jgi:Gas vesicle protein
MMCALPSHHIQSGMDPLVASTEYLISVLDRVLDKGIVLESWVRIVLNGLEPVSVDARLSAAGISVEASAVYLGYDELGAWVELDKSGNLFPCWRRDLWTK